MNETAIRYRNMITRGLYRGVLKPIFFSHDPEAVHDAMTKAGVTLGKYKIGKVATSTLFSYHNSVLEQNLLGIQFKNPIGLSAGFDKNAELTDILPTVGFGFAEVGSVTGNYCAGNPLPRLWRLPKSQGLVVYYGLRNDGCDSISKKLTGKTFKIPIGVSVAMTNCTENINIKSAVLDYAKAFRTMEPVAQYLTVNISCPNTLGGQPFIVPYNLDYLLDIIDEIPTSKPIFIKLSPDMNNEKLDAVLDVVMKHRVHGIICTNLTKKRDPQKIKEEHTPTLGGISGKVVQESADDMLKSVYKKTQGKYVLVGSGGVFTAEDAYKKIRLGASLIQIITGMVFEGPQVISEINQGLVALLERDGFNHISQAIGIDNQ